MKTCFLFLVGLGTLLPFRGYPQNFWNLDFEYGLYKAQPRIWSIEGEGENYSAQLDSTTTYSGHRSLHLVLKNAQVFLFVPIPAKLIAGKTVTLEGYVKFAQSDSLQARLLFHNPSTSSPIASESIISADKTWKVVAHQASFPVNYSSDRLLVALSAEGTGEYWIDAISIKIDGRQQGNGAPDFKEPTRSELQALNKKAIPIQSIDPQSRSNDLAPLKRLIGRARIVALGENSHGSASIYQLKLRLVKHLVEQAGFTVFALEMPMLEADRINDYLLNGKGTRQEVAKNLSYKSWQTKEMMAIIQWLFTYNKTARQKVEFRGFDRPILADKTKSRDEQMARAIEGFLSTCQPACKIIVSADNTHVTKSSGKMGDFLHRHYGKDYLAVGFTYGRGTYSAYGPEPYYEVHPPYVGTYEYFFSKSDYPNFLLDLRTTGAIPILNQSAGFRSIGSRPQETTQFAEIRIKNHFDLIVYQAESVHTTYLTK
ncbi:erythromycin esterase family protein [Spirosoma endbachense]|uniref:Erythromycin esterase family protein n=1 Tax=Spirosoma endbachense TaxID=2666025 RepID=A0A6P1VY75_9BACT|nr:erythromycin esterase family protein [Spirosoma endbachense]QHV98161.1 hypothetical protein GJR95_25545 [Spirosoma endbachense]